MTLNLEISGRTCDRFGDFKGPLWPFWGYKKLFSALFQSCSGVFRKCFGILLGINRPTSGSFSQQRRSPKFILSFGVPLKPYLTSMTLQQDFLFREFSNWQSNRAWALKQGGPEAWNHAAGHRTVTYWKSQIHFPKRLGYCMHYHWLL